MKAILSILTLVLAFSFTKAQAQSSIPEEYYFDYTDTDGNNHNLQDYFDQGKSVFIFNFDNSYYTYQVFENLNLIDFYNTYGQGGNNDVVVLCAAVYGFDTYESLSNLDFSSQLGVGYENVSYTENNPIPMIINPMPGDSIEYLGYGSLNMLCYDDHYTYFHNGNSELYMNTLYDICCTSLETYDPGIESVFSYTPNCNTLSVNYRLTNGTPTPFNSTDIGVWINGEFDSQFTSSQMVEGCNSVPLEYTNPNFTVGDEITFAIANPNTNTSNDTMHTFLQIVDTVSGRIRLEIDNLSDTDPYAYLDSYSDGYTSTFASSANNYMGELYLTEGCYKLSGGVEYYDSEFSSTVHITSIDSNGSTEDTLYTVTGSIGMNDSLQFSNLLIYVNEPAAPLISGYIYEDVDINQQFHPTLPRISGVEITHGQYSSFSNTNGYYELPMGDVTDPISITYNEAVWPNITTPNPLFYQQYNSTYNFGLNQDDPVYGLHLAFNPNLPVICGYDLYQYLSIQNTGNQTTGGEVDLTYDPLLTPISFSPQPTNILDNVLTYQVPDISINGTFGIQITYAEQPVELMGETVETQIELWYEDENNNLVFAESHTSADSVYCSYDPNDIYGFPLGSGGEGLIPANTDLDYRIRFQNTGNYPATTVVLVNTLPQELNWDSFIPKSSSHDYLIQRDEATREIRWTFNNINLPDSSSDPLGSIGNVWYSVDMNDLDQGDQILNQAEIYFDFNLPIYTNTSVHTIEGVTSVAKRQNALPFTISPNPAQETITIKFTKLSNSLVEIYDLQGRKCLETRADAEQVNIPIHHLENGMYLIAITKGSEQTQTTARFVKL